MNNIIENNKYLSSMGYGGLCFILLSFYFISELHVIYIFVFPSEVNASHENICLTLMNAVCGTILAENGCLLKSFKCIIQY